MKEPASNLRHETARRVPIYTPHSAVPLVLAFGLALLASCGGGSAIPPQITVQPVSQTVNVGQTATLTVSATDAMPLAYQWQKNAVNISGAISPT
jgi:Immunoglobulin domain